MNRQITRLALAGVVLLGALIVATTYWQTWAAGDLADRQDNADPARRAVHDRARRDHDAAARCSRATWRRRSAAGRSTSATTRSGGLAAHVVGYSTQSRSRAGLERSMNDYLTGSNANLSTVLDTTLDRLKGATIEGNDLHLTLDARAQQVALAVARQPLRRRRRARGRHRHGARDGLLADLRPEPRRGQLRPGHRHARRLQASGRARSTAPRTASTRRARRSRS